MQGAGEAGLLWWNNRCRMLPSREGPKWGELIPEWGELQR